MKKVTQHFGHCANFNIFEAEDNQIIKGESVPNPGHRRGFLPVFLNDMGVNVIISGGMGAALLISLIQKVSKLLSGQAVMPGQQRKHICRVP